MRLSSRRAAAFLLVSAMAPILAFGAASVPAAASGGGNDQGSTYSVRQILSGETLMHRFIPMGSTTTTTEGLRDPDDITLLGKNIFVGFQNGVGPQGEPSTSSGNLDSTIVELTMTGAPVAQWDVKGKADGVTADPQSDEVIVTVNEDANSSLYAIDPDATMASQQVVHYGYDVPLPHNGGTDAISVDQGHLFISASAPGTNGASAPQPTYPAVYRVTLDREKRIAHVSPLFYDEDQATVANLNSASRGQRVALALTDPDSNEVVPEGARFGGTFMLTSQGDLQQIYVADPAGPHQKLFVLSLSQSVDDTAWPTQSGGSLFSTDSTNDSVDVVTGPFASGRPVVVATPCGANDAPSTCPAPGFSANYLASLNPFTGTVSQLPTTGAPYTPQGGLLYVSEGGAGDSQS